MWLWMCFIYIHFFISLNFEKLYSYCALFFCKKRLVKEAALTRYSSWFSRMSKDASSTDLRYCWVVIELIVWLVNGYYIGNKLFTLCSSENSNYTAVPASSIGPRVVSMDTCHSILKAYQVTRFVVFCQTFHTERMLCRMPFNIYGIKFWCLCG